MDMQTLLAFVVVLAIIRPTIVMVMIAAVIMVAVVVMVAMMNMARLIVRVHVHQKARECANGGCKGHAHGWREGKHRRHRPNEGNAASACSFQARQHGLCPFSSSIDYRGVAFLRPDASNKPVGVVEAFTAMLPQVRSHIVSRTFVRSGCIDLPGQRYLVISLNSSIAPRFPRATGPIACSRQCSI